MCCEWLDVVGGHRVRGPRGQSARAEGLIDDCSEHRLNLEQPIGLSHPRVVHTRSPPAQAGQPLLACVCDAGSADAAPPDWGRPCQLSCDFILISERSVCSWRAACLVVACGDRSESPTRSIAEPVARLVRWWRTRRIQAAEPGSNGGGQEGAQVCQRSARRGVRRRRRWAFSETVKAVPVVCRVQGALPD